MKHTINLPELENPINSNFKKESFTGAGPCLVVGVFLAIL